MRRKLSTSIEINPDNGEAFPIAEEVLDVPAIPHCEECGVLATRGYTVDGRRYCDRHGEDAIRRSTREAIHPDAGMGHKGHRRHGQVKHNHY